MLYFLNSAPFKDLFLPCFFFCTVIVVLPLIIYVAFRAQMYTYSRIGDARRSLLFKSAYCRLGMTCFGWLISPQKRTAYREFLLVLSATVALAHNDPSRFLKYLQKAKWSEEKKFWLAVYYLGICHDSAKAREIMDQPGEKSAMIALKEAQRLETIFVPLEEQADKMLEGMYCIETGEIEKGYALLQEIRFSLRYDASKRVLQQYFDAYGDGERAKADERAFAESMAEVRDILVRDYPLEIKMAGELECFRLDKLRFVVFWDEQVQKNTNAMQRIVQELCAKTACIDFPKKRLLIVVAETEDVFAANDLALYGIEGKTGAVGLNIFFYLIDRKKRKSYMNHTQSIGMGGCGKKQMEKIDSILKRTFLN